MRVHDRSVATLLSSLAYMLKQVKARRRSWIPWFLLALPTSYICDLLQQSDFVQVTSLQNLIKSVVLTVARGGFEDRLGPQSARDRLGSK